MNRNLCSREKPSTSFNCKVLQLKGKLFDTARWFKVVVLHLISLHLQNLLLLFSLLGFSCVTAPLCPLHQLPPRNNEIGLLCDITLHPGIVSCRAIKWLVIRRSPQLTTYECMQTPNSRPAETGGGGGLNKKENGRRKKRNNFTPELHDRNISVLRCFSLCLVRLVSHEPICICEI